MAITNLSYLNDAMVFTNDRYIVSMIKAQFCIKWLENSGNVDTNSLQGHYRSLRTIDRL